MPTGLRAHPRPGPPPLRRRRAPTWVVSRVGAWEGLSSGSLLDLIRVVMLVCVRVWGVHVRLMTMSMMSTSMPCGVS
jgi:hypothetical protein